MVANIVACVRRLALRRTLQVARTTFLYSTIMLAFARLYPNFTLNLFFILPIQIKWLALLAWIGLGYGLVTGDWMQRLLIVASVANYLVFFGRDHWRDLKQGQRRRAFQARTEKASQAPVPQMPHLWSG